MASEDDKDRLTLVKKMYRRYKRKFAAVNDMWPEELMQLQSDPEANVLLVDCRKQEEIDVSVIEGNVVTQDELEEMDVDDATLQIVFYCTIGYRSGLAAKKFARKRGYSKERVFNLAGSCLSWAHAGGKFVNRATGEVVKRVHVVRPWR